MPRLVKPSAKKKASPRGGAPRGGDARRSLKRTIGMEIAALQKTPILSGLSGVFGETGSDPPDSGAHRGSRHHIGHGKKRPCRAQSRRNLCLHRNARPVRPSQRSQPWRSGHDHKKKTRSSSSHGRAKRKSLRTSSPIRAASRFPSFSSRHGGAAPSPSMPTSPFFFPKWRRHAPSGLPPQAPSFCRWLSETRLL